MRNRHDLNPLSITEAELLALEQEHDRMLDGAKRIRYHLLNCENGDLPTFQAFEELLKYIGFHDEVVKATTDKTPKQRWAEMACETGE